MTSLASLNAFKKQIEFLSNTESSEVEPFIQIYSYARTLGKSPPELADCVNSALFSLREMPTLVYRMEAIVCNEALPAFQRLGAYLSLLYGAAPNDILPDYVGGAYGYLDDWIILASAWWTYVQSPPPADLAQLSHRAGHVWLAIPAAQVPALQGFVTKMEPEREWLKQQPESQVEATLKNLLAAPVPDQFLPSQATNVPVQRSSNDWSVNGAGATWSDGQGSLYMRFAGGGSIGRTKSGDIVGLPY